MFCLSYTVIHFVVKRLDALSSIKIGFDLICIYDSCFSPCTISPSPLNRVGVESMTIKIVKQGDCWQPL